MQGAKCFNTPLLYTTHYHKDNFRNNTKCRLINHSKSKVGHVSKNYMKETIEDVSRKTEIDQWHNTAIVSNWFKNLSGKLKVKFIKFDIAEFETSISEKSFK